MLKRFATVATLVAIENIAIYSMYKPVMFRIFTIQQFSTENLGCTKNQTYNLDKSCHKHRKGFNIMYIEKNRMYHTRVTNDIQSVHWTNDEY